MESTQAGFLAQLKGKLTTRCYTAATAFEDHFSYLQYVHLITSLMLGEIIKIQNAFKRFESDHGVRIKQYHADNGQFADNVFRRHCDQYRQTISYCRDVSLALNLNTGPVSPQFHCRFDNFIETTHYSDRDIWKHLAGFHIVISIGTSEDYPPSEPNNTPDHFINNDMTNFDSIQEDLV
ncbi:hypothetical protein ACHAW6_004575 [Cyclotella cf. meneghiniana]